MFVFLGVLDTYRAFKGKLRYQRTYMYFGQPLYMYSNSVTASNKARDQINSNVHSGRFHTRGQTNHLMDNLFDVQNHEQIFQRTDRLIFGRLERQFSQHDLAIERNKSTTVRHKFTSDGQIPDDLIVL